MDDALRRRLSEWSQSRDRDLARSLLRAFSRAEPASLPRDLAHDFLDLTSDPDFLGALDRESRDEVWAPLCIRLIERSRYTLGTLLERRAEEDPERVYLVEATATGRRSWGVGPLRQRARRYAATFIARGRHEEGPSDRPRVALYLDNSVAGACCDLGCLTEGIVVTPLSVHTPLDHLHWILRRLDIDLVVTDTEERQQRLCDLRRKGKSTFGILSLEDSAWVRTGDVERLDDLAAALSPQQVESLLADRREVDPRAISTVMFTSGSTGRPKGVAFTDLHLVTKRFCRAAALPAVGRDEILLCYLPLYHTFGRFLELLAMLYWRGRYVFVGNTSAETFLSALPEVEPTGLIGIPLRWKQMRDRCLEAMDRVSSGEEKEAALRQVVGSGLRWGLSAAGYLDPRIFRFFHRHGVELCSGFGMTEATGGITMSPAGDYVDDSVGRPLPGIDLVLDAQGEMSIGGPYVADYLDPDAEGLVCLPRPEASPKTWLRTGDLFRELENGQLQIVDRIKDIYKNDRGQTIAPRKIERILEETAGVRRAFLVGDHRSWNVLLIVPDREDAVLAQLGTPDREREYFQRIIAAAN